MKVSRILNPLTGERVVGVDPAMRPNFEADWRRRLNLYTGRALSDTALTTEQEGRAGRLATRGQMVSHGVVSGLEVEVQAEAMTDRARGTVTVTPFYQIAPGIGIAASGEDVVVSRPLRIDVLNVRVYAPTRIVAAIDRSPEDGGDSPVRPIAVGEGVELLGPPQAIRRRSPGDEFAALSLRALEARTLGPPLRELIGKEVNDTVPRAGVLLLQPLVAEVVGEFDDNDPCEQDPQGFAFEDWGLVDGARLVLYIWPTELSPLPAPGPQMRNDLAYVIFDEERHYGPEQLLPWQEVGVPIGLVGFDAEWRPTFIDRYSVVRAGGKPRRRSMLVPGSGNAFLWQARVEQFAEQITDGAIRNAPIGELSAQFHFLPPVGLLPRGAVDFTFADDATTQPAARNNFFPAGYEIEAVPVPLEQLDVAMEASAPLAPFDATATDQVQVLVPVPEIWYEPELLKKKLVSEEFQTAITKFTDDETQWKHRRKDVRKKASLIIKAVTGKAPEYADPDPEGDVTLDPPEESFGTEGPAAAPNVVIEYERLKASLAGMGAAIAAEVPNLNAKGLRPFIDYLQGVINSANDKIDFGFLNVQTDIYRIRQQVLGNTAATRLATSPALAGIAKGDSAVATRESIKDFANRVKLESLRGPDAAPPAAGGPAASGTTITRGFSGSGRSELFVAGEKITPIRPEAGLVSGFNVGDLFLSRTDVSLTGGIVAEQEKTARPGISEFVSAQSAAGAAQFFRDRTPSPVDVVEQSAIVGESIQFRTVTIAARLEQPESAESRNYAVGEKHQVISGLADMEMNLTGIDVPGVRANPGDNQSPNVTFDQLKDAATRGRILGEIINNVHDPVPSDTDEAGNFSVAVRALDHTIGLLRKVEGRVQLYRRALEACRESLAVLEGLIVRVNLRLNVIEDGLAEARHDLTVAKALLAEEQARVKAINDRRMLIISEQVRFLAYQRPRAADLLVATPMRALEPGLTEAPVPACLGRGAATPPDLRAMVELLREVPVKWLTYVHPLVDRLDRVETLQETVRSAKLRAQVQYPARQAEITMQVKSSAGLLSRAIDTVFTAQRSVVSQQRVQMAQLDLGPFVEQKWQLIRDRAKETVSLGDLIDAGHGRSDVAQQGSRELNDISRVATCLYEMFGEVLPAIRLDWAERLSQYDAPINLRSLSSLPRWAEKGADGEDLIAFVDRREMQTLADWLYQRVDPLQPEATSLINDVVRICILLASHAPVKQIIAGHVPRPTTVKKGGRVELAAVDLTKIRVGMHVLMRSGEDVVTRGVVDDLTEGKASARVVDIFQKDEPAGAVGRAAQPDEKSVRLDQNTRVEFAEPDAFDRGAIAIYKAQGKVNR
ncbi:MAG TPA: hypothetical protein VNI02_21825 [Blastocatellia bacterium]|nr:hypothetical protein [Blastocatellia bacterium]